MTNFFCACAYTCGALNIHNNKNVVIFIFVIAVEYEINLLRKFPELRYIYRDIWIPQQILHNIYAHWCASSNVHTCMQIIRVKSQSVCRAEVRRHRVKKEKCSAEDRNNQK